MSTSASEISKEIIPTPFSLRQASCVLRVVLLAAAEYGAVAQYCPAGAVQAACDKVVVLYSAYTSEAAGVQSKLRDTGAFVTVDTLNTFPGTPSLAQLGAYDAVLEYSGDVVGSNSVLLGDRLAAYHDQGGGVVVAYAANTAGYGNARLQGVYGTPSNGYALMDYASGGIISPSDSLGDVLEPQSPLMAGVASFTASGYRSTAAVISGRGVVVARWRGGGLEPLVLRGTRRNRTLVELNFYPTPSFWTGDGALLMRNGLKYSRCMLCGMGTYANAGEAREGVRVLVGGRGVKGGSVGCIFKGPYLTVFDHICPESPLSHCNSHSHTFSLSPYSISLSLSLSLSSSLSLLKFSASLSLPASASVCLSVCGRVEIPENTHTYTHTAER